jgi:hypothetical protein
VTNPKVTLKSNDSKPTTVAGGTFGMVLLDNLITDFRVVRITSITLGSDKVT